MKNDGQCMGSGDLSRDDDRQMTEDASCFILLTYSHSIAASFYFILSVNTVG